MRRTILIVAMCAAMPTFAQYLPPINETVSKPVTIVWHKTTEAWKACKHFYPNNRGCLDAVGVFVEINGVCHVYAPDARVDYGQPQWYGAWWAVGHEAKHCFDGLFHF